MLLEDLNGHTKTKVRVTRSVQKPIRHSTHLSLETEVTETSSEICSIRKCLITIHHVSNLRATKWSEGVLRNNLLSYYLLLL